MIRVAAETFPVVPRIGSEGRSILHSKVSNVFMPIKTTLTLIEDQQTRICIISTHFICEAYSLSNLYRTNVAKALGLPKENTFFFSSHNHTDAALTREQPGFGTPQYDACCSEDGLTVEGKNLLKGMVKTARRLPVKLAPVQVAWGAGHERRITYNRKGRRADGTTYLMREEDRVMLGEDFNGDIEDEAFVVGFIGADGKPVSFLTQFTGHPTTAYHPEFPIVHGDFPQVACDDLSAAYGGVPVGFLQGCAGEMNSKGLVSLDPVKVKVANANRFGHYLGKTFIQVAKKMRTSERASIGFSRERVPLPFVKLPSAHTLQRQIAEADEFLRRCEQGEENTLTCLGLNVARNMSKQYRGGLVKPHQRWAEWALGFHTGNRRKKAPQSVKVEVTALRLGDVGITGLACEPFSGIGRQIKRQTSLPVAIPCGYIDDNSVAYIPDGPNNGDREYNSSFYRYTTSLLPYKNPAGDLLARAGVRMLSQLAQTSETTISPEPSARKAKGR